jgi:hypothetical protein
MSLDIYIADSDKALVTAKRSGSLSTFDHERLRESGVFSRGGILMRLADYYKDAKVHVSELPQALGELQRARDEIGDGATYVLDDLLAIFKDAVDRGAHVYFRAD